MWPDLFGPGWVWGLLSASGLLAACVTLVCLLGRAETPDSDPDTFQELWRRYEQGDLTPWEFERLRPASTRFFFLPVACSARPTQGSSAGDQRAKDYGVKAPERRLASV